MSEKPNLAEDFEEANHAADMAVIRMLKQTSVDDARNGTSPETSKASGPTRRSKKAPAGNSGPPDRCADSTATRRGKNVSVKPVTWSRPTALFNTRIPPEMGELLDELLYRLRKERRESGAAVTKQALALEAFEDLLRKYSLIGS